MSLMSSSPTTLATTTTKAGQQDETRADKVPMMNVFDECVEKKETVDKFFVPKINNSRSSWAIMNLERS